MTECRIISFIFWRFYRKRNLYIDANVFDVRKFGTVQRQAVPANREFEQVVDSSVRVTACNATDSLGRIGLFCPYSSEITPIECYCSRMIDFPSLSVLFGTAPLQSISLIYAVENADNPALRIFVISLHVCARIHMLTCIVWYTMYVYDTYVCTSCIVVLIYIAIR